MPTSTSVCTRTPRWKRCEGSCQLSVVSRRVSCDHHCHPERSVRSCDHHCHPERSVRSCDHHCHPERSVRIEFPIRFGSGGRGVEGSAVRVRARLVQCGLYQGTTSVVPNEDRKIRGFSPCGSAALQHRVKQERFVTGHDFSRAEGWQENDGALAPALNQN